MARKKPKRGSSLIGIEADEGMITLLNKTFRMLGEKDAPWLREALDESGKKLADETRARAPGGIAGGVKYKGVKGNKAHLLRAQGVVRHPGARSMEFGRYWYWTGYTGRKPKTGTKYRVAKGQAPRPYLGVKGGGANDAVYPFAQQRILQAIAQEWERLGVD